MGPGDLRWFDLFHRKGTRRDFLRAGPSAAALVALGGVLPARRGDAAPRFRTDPFQLGVASGDPHPDGLVLWTRLAPGVVLDHGVDSPVPVRWEVADDPAFRQGVRRGDTLALPELGWSVHAEVGGLEPDRVYHYRFLAGGAASPVGRGRTAPLPGAPTRRLRFAFCSCQNWEEGWYTAYRHMAGEDLDLVVHLGDYIYEGGVSRRSVRPNGRDEVHTLEDYRARHAQYRGDPHLQAAHAAFSWVVTWDDHDVDNNYAAGIPQDRERQDPAAFLLRRAAAYQAYYEFLPLRRSSVPRGPDMLLYRRLRFGDLLSLDVLDTRQYRDDQACGDRFKPDCDERFHPHRSLLGPAQERWLLDGLATPGARWSVLAQQVMMAPFQLWDREGQATRSMDTWDGYPVARQRLLDALAHAPGNPVVLTGDTHSSWVAELRAGEAEAPVVATELIGTSITTNADGSDVDPRNDPIVDDNPWFVYHEERRGYVSCELTRGRLSAHFRFVPFVSRPDAPLETRASFVVEHGHPGAVRDR